MINTVLSIEAPAKINVHLRVKKRRLDGYHELESVFLALALGDVLCFELTGDEGECVIHGAGDIPRGRNIVDKAVSLFRARTGFSRGVRVCLEKRIPLGAGLGGGSSDAASTLRALNVLGATDLSEEALLAMAQSLGSDVPFFLYGGAAFVSGRGERIRPIEAPRGLWVVLVYPGFPSGTAEAFRLLDETREQTMPGEVDPGDTLSPAVLIGALQEHPSQWPYGNDFLPVFLTAGIPEAAEAYRRILADLAALGADFSGLSGAGSSCFGIFIDGGVAEKAKNILAQQWNFVQLTFFLARLGNGVLK
ncbi:MAG: 4-(cytidine 5'-diphospho)-2-C-methyl-D-erythritol kinase [Treponema sp.]|nr:4-(cytidine 5'-diphospho)-2-C-methyl-D-erythritol kinase [Treponema sp.]